MADTLTVQEAGNSLNDLVNRVRAAFDTLTGYAYWVNDVFPESIVASKSDEQGNRRYYKIGMSVTDDAVTFADESTWEQVMLDYVPMSAEPVEEALRFDVSLPVREVRTNEDGTIDGVIVVEGKSANDNVYTMAALKSGVNVFSGAMMFADHPTRTEEAQRPERSVRDVVGRVTEAYVGTNKEGKPALRGKFLISESEAQLKTKISEGIIDGLSLRAFGEGKRDKSGEFIVENFQPNPFTSVDVVTVAAAGGSFETLSESQRDVITQAVLESVSAEQLKQARPDLVSENEREPIEEGEQPREQRRLVESEGDVMTQELTEVQAERDRLLEENTKLFTEVRTFKAEQALAGVMEAYKRLPAATQDRIKSAAAPMIETFATHGSEQTVEELTAALKQIAEAERAYVAKLVPNGAVTGGTQTTPLALNEGAVDAELAEAMSEIVPAGSLQVALRGR